MTIEKEKCFYSYSDLEGKLINIPDIRKAIEYLGSTKLWEESCTREIEKFGGDTVLINEERMKKADRHLKKWIDMTERLLSRHPSTKVSFAKDIHENLTILDSSGR